MKKIPALLLVFVMIFQLILCNVSFADGSLVFTGIQYTTGTPRQTNQDSGYVMIDSSYAVGYKVSLPYPAGAMKLTYRTAVDENGVIDIRLGGVTGEIIGSLETDKITADWANYTNVIGFSMPIDGTQEIWITVSKGTIGKGGAHWICNFELLPSESTKTFATFKQEDAYIDIEEDENNQEINLLSDLDILPKEDTSFSPLQPMTRIEFVSALGKIIDAEKYASEESPFMDVEDGSENADILSGLYNLGIIKGDTDGNFRAISFITPYEAATVCINALGYEDFSNDMNTVLGIAGSLDLFDGIKFTNRVTRSQGAKLLYNLFLADYLAVREVGEEEIFYNPTKNYLEKATVYKHSKGVMTANFVTKLYSTQKSEGIKIDDVTYLVNKPINVDYLGAYCEFFYHEENGDRVLDALRPVPKVEWNYIEATPDIRFDAISERKIEYTKISTDEEFEYEIDSKTAIIYNATALSKSLVSLIPNPRNFEGAITIIDNNGDGVLETVWIDHVTRVIEVSAVSNGRIKDELTGELYNTTDKTFELFVNGNSAYVDELTKGTIITIYESTDSGKDKYVRSIADGNQVSGTIQKSADGKYTIQGEEYRVSRFCQDELYVGLTGTFMLDKYNFIVSCTEGESSELKLGLYLANSGLDTSSLDAQFEIKLLTDNGVEKYIVAKKIIADGVTVKRAEDFYNGSTLFTGIKNVAVNSPVLYRQNINGEISLIDTINDGAENSDDQLTNILSDQDNNPVNVINTSSYYVYNSTMVNPSTWVPEYGVNSKVKVIGLSGDGDELKHRIVSGYTADENSVFVMAPYAFSKDTLVADALLIYNYSLVSGTHDFPFIVDRIAEAIDEKGETVKKIYGFSKDKKVDYLVDDESYFSKLALRNIVNSLNKGDLVRPTINNGKITELELLYIHEPQEGEKFGPATNAGGIATLLNKDSRTYSGTGTTVNLCEVVGIEDGFVKVTIQRDISGVSTDKLHVFNAGAANVALCEKNPNGTYTITQGLPIDVMIKGDVVVTARSSRPGLVTALYVFRDNSQ